MILEVLFSGILVVFFSYCAINAMMTLPADVAGELSAKQWSVTILLLAILFLVINIVNVIRKTPKDQRNFSALTEIKFENIIRSRLLWGVVAMVGYTALVDTLGFLVTTFLFCNVFCMLLGEKKVPKAVLFSLILTVILFFIFFKGMGVILPRGVGFLRDFSRVAEKLLRNLF